MTGTKMLVESATGFKYLSMLDGYYVYNQIFIADDGISMSRSLKHP